MRLFQINRDPDPAENEEGSAIDPIEAAMNEQMPEDVVEDPKEGEETPEKKEEPKEEESENLIEVEGYKGKCRRGKRFEGDERRADIIDKRNNIELDFEFGNGDQKSKKLSMAEVKSTLKWLQDNNQAAIAGIDMNNYAQKHPEFGKVISAIIKGSFGENASFNPEFANKVMAAVEAKEEVIDEKVDEIDDGIAKIEKILADEEIDPDSPQADGLRSSIASMKAMKKQLASQQKALDDVTKKFEGFEEKGKSASEAKTKEDYQAEVNRIAKLFNGEMQGLTEKGKEGAYEFIVEAESTEFTSLVRAGVMQAVADLKLKEGESVSDKQFKEFIANSAKDAYKEIQSKREAIQQAYAKKKGWKKEEKKTEKEIPETKDDMNIGDLSDAIESELANGSG